MPRQVWNYKSVEQYRLGIPMFVPDVAMVMSLGLSDRTIYNCGYGCGVLGDQSMARGLPAASLANPLPSLLPAPPSPKWQ